jgi:hypothetical protein
VFAAVTTRESKCSVSNSQELMLEDFDLASGDCGVGETMFLCSDAVDKVFANPGS